MNGMFTELRKVSEEALDSYRASVPVRIMATEEIRAVSGGISLSYTIEFDHRPHGIKGMSVTMHRQTEVPAVYEETREPVDIAVDLSQLRIMWTPGDGIYPAEAVLYLNRDHTVNYGRSYVEFAYIDKGE